MIEVQKDRKKARKRERRETNLGENWASWVERVCSKCAKPTQRGVKKLSRRFYRTR